MPAQPEKRRIKKTETVRERAGRAQKDSAKPRRIKKAADKTARPLSLLRQAHQKEVYLPLPDNKIGAFLNKRRRLVPKFLRGAWAEIRQVTWPTRRETIKFTFAVVMFAFFLGALITITDFGLEKLFKEVLLG